MRDMVIPTSSICHSMDVKQSRCRRTLRAHFQVLALSKSSQLGSHAPHALHRRRRLPWVSSRARQRTLGNRFWKRTGKGLWIGVHMVWMGISWFSGASLGTLVEHGRLFRRGPFRFHHVLASCAVAIPRRIAAPQPTMEAPSTHSSVASELRFCDHLGAESLLAALPNAVHEVRRLRSVRKVSRGSNSYLLPRLVLG